MKSDETSLYSGSIKAREHFFGKMESRRWTRRRTGVRSIHILVTLAVVLGVSALYLRRQRDMTVALKPFFINCKIKL